MHVLSGAHSTFNFRSWLEADNLSLNKIRPLLGLNQLNDLGWEPAYSSRKFETIMS